MPTMHTLQGGRVLDTAWRNGELPALTTIDRIALRLGLRLILWGQRSTERAERAEQARSTRAAFRASTARSDAFERRAFSGPTW